MKRVPHHSVTCNNMTELTVKCLFSIFYWHFKLAFSKTLLEREILIQNTHSEKLLVLKTAMILSYLSFCHIVT